MNLLSTGISSLDHLLGGGVAKGSTVLLIGPVGSGKTYVVQHFVYSCLTAGERCLYVATLESQGDFEESVKLNFGWDLKPFFKSGHLRFESLKDFWDLQPTQSTFEQVMEKVYSWVRDCGDARVVVNNTSHLFNFSREAQPVVRAIALLKLNAKKSGSTVLLIMDKGCVYTLLEENVKSICDYVLETACINNVERAIRVSKSIVRHGLDWHRIRIRREGIEVEVLH